MYKPTNNPGKLYFEKRVIGASSRLQRENVGRVHVECMTSTNNGTGQVSRSCSSPPLGGTLRGTSSCVLEILTADPPLTLENTTMTTSGNRQDGEDTLFLATDEGSGVEDDSVVVEMVEPSSPSICVKTCASPSSRIALLTLSQDHPSTLSGVGEFTSSPNKRSKSDSKKCRSKDSNDCSSKPGLRWQNSSVGGFTHSSMGGVTHSSVTRSQDSTEKGPMRVSLAHKALIGKGSFGVVFQAMDRDTNHIIAVKEIAVSRGSDKALEAVRKELALLKLLDHPRIVKCLGEECDENCLRIYLEYVSGGSISSVLRTFGPFQEKQASIYTRQMLEGLAYLHSKNIMHRDLKGDNLLVDPNGTLKISDFGTAKHLLDHNGSNALAGTAYFMAPEVILAQTVGLSSDVWSVGCCVIEMLTGSPPFSDVKNQYSMMMRVAQSTVELFPEMIPKEHNFSRKAIAFLRRCLQRNPSKRPRMQELLMDEWILFPPEDTGPAYLETKSTGKQPCLGNMTGGGGDANGLTSSVPPITAGRRGVHQKHEGGPSGDGGRQKNTHTNTRRNPPEPTR